MIGYSALVIGSAFVALLVCFPVLVFGFLKYKSFRHSRLAFSVLPFSACSVFLCVQELARDYFGFNLGEYIPPLYELVLFLIGVTLISFKLSGAPMREVRTSLLYFLLPLIFLIVLFLSLTLEGLQSIREYVGIARVQGSLSLLLQLPSVLWAMACFSRFCIRRVHRLRKENVKSGEPGGNSLDGPPILSA